MHTRSRWLAPAAVALVLSVPVGLSRGQDAGAASEAVAIPTTIERIWYRAAKKQGFAKLKAIKVTGDLTITSEGLEIVGKKDSISIPLESISMLSYGTMGRDVDTEWAVMEIDTGGGSQRVGFRDGSRMGYGHKTREIYETLRRLMKQLTAAQYRVPEGYEAFDELDHQFTIAIPEGWSNYLQSVVIIGDRMPWGRIIFSAEPVRRDPQAREGDGVSLESVQRGEAPAFFLDRREARKGKACSGFTPPQRAELLEQVNSELRLDGGFEPTGQPELSPFSVNGCKGLKIVARSRDADGAERVLDLRAVSDGETVFVFGMRGSAAHVERNRDPFETSVASLKFAVAR